MNFNLNSKDIIRESFILTGEIQDKDLINKLKEKIKEKVKSSKLHYKTNVKGKFSGFDSFVEDIDFHLFLKTIQPQIQIIYRKNFRIIGAWGNICNKGDEVLLHNHRDVTAFCGILYLTENGPGTYFKEYDLLIEEKIGKFILFDPYLNHSVDKIKDDIDRITLAFNTHEFKEWENNQNIKWIGK
jgi:hypothetical protein